MTVKQFLIENKVVNLAELARLMYGDENKRAKTTLYEKLKDTRPWNETDEALALAALRKLAVDITALG